MRRAIIADQERKWETMSGYKMGGRERTGLCLRRKEMVLEMSEKERRYLEKRRLKLGQGGVRKRRQQVRPEQEDGEGGKGGGSGGSSDEDVWLKCEVLFGKYCDWLEAIFMSAPISFDRVSM
jgi:hypothetical protein